MTCRSRKAARPIASARRVGEVKEYYFSRKLREVAALRAQGRDIISLAVGGPDRPPSPAVVEKLCEQARRADTHSYQPYTGIVELRQAMARFYSRHFGVELDAAREILPLIGSKEGILHVSLAFLNPGDAVLVPNPGYPTYTSVSRLVGAEVLPYDLTEQGGYLPDFDAIGRLLDQRERDGRTRAKVMWVNYPHMPTGTPASEQLFRRLVDFARERGLLLACDNPYSFILNDSPLSILAVEGAREVAVELNSMSKSHNMAGWRVGMMAGKPEFVEWVLKVKSNIDSGQFRPLQLAAVEGLDAPDSWYAEVNAEYRHRRLVAERIMTALGCSFNPAQQGLFLWGRLPQHSETSEQFVDRLLAEKDIFITPGSIFGSNGEGYVRISLCSPVATLEKALHRL